MIVEEVEDIKAYIESAGTIAWIASLVILVFFYVVGCSSVYPWLKTTFLPDANHKHAGIARNIIIFSYFLVVTAFIIGIMRPAIEGVINGSAGNSTPTTTADANGEPYSSHIG